MKLEGSLDAFSLPDVFQLLSLTKKSGGLHLTNGQAAGVVYFAGGLITGASSDVSRQGLARRLVGMGACDDAGLRRAVERALSEPVGVARALVESGTADPEVVRGHAVEQTVDSVFDLLRWPDGDFAFAVDEPDPDDVGITLASEEVVAEATARRETWESVSRVIPSPDVVLVMPVVVAEPPVLGREEWALLALVDGHRTVGELVEVSGVGPFSVVSMLATLVQRGSLALRDEEAPDHVALVRRRQLLLAPLEPAVPASAQQVADPEPALDPRSDVGMVAPQAVLSALPTDRMVPEPGFAAPAVETPDAQQVASLELPLVGGAHSPAGVVPARPEPFLPRRQPDHPEPVPASRGFVAPAPVATVGAPVARPGAMSGLGAAATAPAGDPSIERDPSVNRSLLLRLIAGVRGL